MPTSNNERRARVLVVDDHPMVREGISDLISRQDDMVCCGGVGSPTEAQAAVGREKPDLVILDLRLRNGDGLELIKVLRAQFAKLPILVLSQHDERLYVERALRAGAMGFLTKEDAAAEVLNAIRVVLRGEIYLTGRMAAQLLHRLVRPAAKTGRPGLEALSDRELHVLRLLGAGMSTREIAAELHLSFKTIEAHRENIKRKLGLSSAAELVNFATRNA